MPATRQGRMVYNYYGVHPPTHRVLTPNRVWSIMYTRIRKAYRAEVAELADARDSKSRAPCGHEGSTPSFGTKNKSHTVQYSPQQSTNKPARLFVTNSSLTNYGRNIAST